MISAQIFDPKLHYETVASWWDAQEWPVIPLTHLSRNGIIVFCNDVPAAAGWIYQTDSAFAWFEWIVANPEIRKEDRADSISALIEHAKVVAKKLGKKTVFMTAKNESLISRLHKHGFLTTEQNMKNLVVNIDGRT